MRVLVDATNCKPEQGGIRTYTLSLCRALADRPDLSLAIITSVGDFDSLPADILHVSKDTRGFAARAAWREASLAKAVRAVGAQVVFTPTPELPIRRLPVPSVIVVHDVGPATAPRLYGNLRWLRYRLTLPRCLHSATKVVCVSRTSLDAVVSTFGVSRSKCVVISEGLSPILDGLAPTSDDDSDTPYVLYVGSLYRHKNAPTLVRAWGHGGVLSETQLRLVGPRDDKEGIRRVIKAARDAEATERVDVGGYVSPANLDRLFRKASALALPSLHEGFGLTALEAMGRGVPVVASDIPAVREVVGSAGILVKQPLSSEAWHGALSRVLSDADLADELARAGRARAALFTWENAADELARTLAEVAA